MEMGVRTGRDVMRESGVRTGTRGEDGIGARNLTGCGSGSHR